MEYINKSLDLSGSVVFLLFMTIVTTCVKKGVYDDDILGKYTYEEWDKINSWIDHERDMLFTYAGLRQVVDKYLGSGSKFW